MFVFSPMGIVLSIVMFSLGGWTLEVVEAKVAIPTKLAVPLVFQPNSGQFKSEIKFFAQNGRADLLLDTASGLLLSIIHPPLQESLASHAHHASSVQMSFIGANVAPTVKAMGPLSSRYHYFLGSNPQEWRTDILLYEKVRYEDVYSGIDVEYYSADENLEFDMFVSPGADPGKILLGFEGIDTLTIDPLGNLVLVVDDVRLVYKRPVVYQDRMPELYQGNISEGRIHIEGTYRITDEGNVGFQIGAFDSSKPLVIDPVLVHSTYLGGRGFDQGTGVAIDAVGSIFVAGTTNGGFPSKTSLPSVGQQLQQDVFIAKFGAQGDELIYSVVIGGRDIDVANDIRLGPSGDIYVVGTTFSDDFPTTEGALQRNKDGSTDAFILKLNTEGNAFGYSTFLGGAGLDIGLGASVNVLGEAFITGQTRSENFPVSDGALQGKLDGDRDAFVTRLNARGDEVLYSTYLGGGGDEQGQAIVVASSGESVVTGLTGSKKFPITSDAVQPEMGGQEDVFVAKISSDGRDIVYATYLGGGGKDIGRGIALDDLDNMYVVGATLSNNFPTTDGVLQEKLGSLPNTIVNRDAFVSKLSPTGDSLLFSTYLGGRGDDRGNSIAVDDLGRAYITGRTTSENFPTVASLQSQKSGDILGGEMFVARLSVDGGELSYSTYLGGDGDDSGKSIAVDSSHSAYVVGAARSNNFPTNNSFQENFAGESDAVILKISDSEQSNLPDIAAELTKFKHKVKASGDQLVVKLNLRSSRGAKTISPFFVSLFISDDKVFDDTDRPARQSIRVDLLESSKLKFKVKQLEPLLGKFAIIVLDDSNGITESNEENNIFIQAIEVQ